MYDDKKSLDPLGLGTDVFFEDDTVVEENASTDESADADSTPAEAVDLPDNAEDTADEQTDAQVTDAEPVAEAEPEESAEEQTEAPVSEGADEQAEPTAEEAVSEQTEAPAEEVTDSADETAEAEKPADAPEEKEEEPEEKPEDKFLTEYPKEEFEKLIYAHFRTVANAINGLRTKEDSITRLSKEVQKYRDEYVTKSIKPIVMSIITLRESCRKSLASLDKPIEFAKLTKFINYLADDVDDLLSDVGLSCSDESGKLWVYNGTPICKRTVETVTFPEVFELVESEPLTLPTPGDSLTEFLAGCEEAVRAALANIEKYDRCIKDYVKVASAIDEGVLASNVYPVLRNLARFAPRFKADVVDSINALTEENALDEYRALLEALFTKLNELLEACGVDFESVEDGSSYDLKKHKIIKLVPTDEESLDRQVITASTDSYTLNGVVISQAKVTVYKYQPKNN